MKSYPLNFQLVSPDLVGKDTFISSVGHKILSLNRVNSILAVILKMNVSNVWFST